MFLEFVAQYCPKKNIGRGLLALILTSYVAKKLHTKIKINKNVQKINKKRKEIEDRKANLEQRLKIDGDLISPERKLILNKGVKELLKDLKNGSLKPIKVLEAYQAKALSVDKEINAVCDFILEANDWARQLEDIPIDKRGALYGLPISVKVEKTRYLTNRFHLHPPNPKYIIRNVSTCLGMTAPLAWLSILATPGLLTAALWLG